MKHTTTTLFLLACWLTAGAQHRFVVVSTETGVPQRDILVYTDDGQQLTTAWDGVVELADGYATVTLAHPGFEKRVMAVAEAAGTDTVALIPSLHPLREVVVFGHTRSLTERMGPLMSKTDLQLAQPVQQGFNPMGLLLWGVDQLLMKPARHRRAMERQRRQMILDNY